MLHKVNVSVLKPSRICLRDSFIVVIYFVQEFLHLNSRIRYLLLLCGSVLARMDFPRIDATLIFTLIFLLQAAFEWFIVISYCCFSVCADTKNIPVLPDSLKTATRRDTESIPILPGAATGRDFSEHFD